MQGDRGDIVLGWLTRLVVVLGIAGLIGFDLVSLGVGRLQAEDRAATAARAGVSAFRDTQDVQKAYEAALATLDDTVADHLPPEDFSVAEDGSVTLTVVHTSATLIAEKVGPLRDLATSSATTTAHRST